MKKRKKSRGKATIVDPSNALLFVNKYFVDYKKGKLSEEVLALKVMRLFLKFPFKEVIELCPVDILDALRKASSDFTLINESIFTSIGSFGPECDYDRFIQRKLSYMKTIEAQLFFFFKKKDKDKAKRKHGS